MILAERAARVAAEAGLAEARAEAANVKADLTGTEALIAHLKLAIEKLRRALLPRCACVNAMAQRGHVRRVCASQCLRSTCAFFHARNSKL